MKCNATLAGLGVLLMAAGASADWHTIDIGRYGHGRVLDGKTLGPATVRAVNFHDEQSRLVVFDTRKRGTRDPDLEGPNGDGLGYWAQGNVDSQDITGTVLIVQETGASFAGYARNLPMVVAQPDDEERITNGKRPGAGEITFMFDHQIDAFRFTLFDIEENEVFDTHAGSYVVFTGGDQNVKVAFADLIDPNSPYYDPSIQFGNHSANRFPPITAHQLGLLGIERVVINLGGSGAVGDLSYLDEQHEIGAATFRDEIGGSGDGSGSFAYSYETGGGSPGGGGGGPDPGPKNPDDEPDDPISVPSPGAGIAGVLIMSLLAGRRPRKQRHNDRPDQRTS